MKAFFSTVLVGVISFLSFAACMDDISTLDAGKETLTGVSRLTPYGSEQGSRGSCGNFYDIEKDPKKWVGVSEPFLMKYYDMETCDASDKTKPPQCGTDDNKAKICGKKVKARCKGGDCKNKNWVTFTIVEVCPLNREYFKKHDSDYDPNDYACASKTKPVLDVDKDFHQDNWGDNNTSIEVKFIK